MDKGRLAALGREVIPEQFRGAFENQLPQDFVRAANIISKWIDTRLYKKKEFTQEQARRYRQELEAIMAGKAAAAKVA